MEYVGAGQWQGALAGTTFNVLVGSRDKIDLPFVDDPRVIGEWRSADVVATIAEFDPGQPQMQGEFFLKGLIFLENGKTPQPWDVD
jgi:hypothetical protein